MHLLQSEDSYNHIWPVFGLICLGLDLIAWKTRFPVLLTTASLHIIHPHEMSKLTVSLLEYTIKLMILVSKLLIFHFLTATFIPRLVIIAFIHNWFDILDYVIILQILESGFTWFVPNCVPEAIRKELCTNISLNFVKSILFY